MAYRRLQAALWFTIAAHAVGLLAMQFLLRPGLDLSAPLADRRAYLDEHPWRWRLGWVPWQLTALSLVLVSVALVACTRDRWARLALVFTIVGVIPDQVGEYLFQFHLPGAPGGAYEALEARCFVLTGVCGNTGYTLMAVGWMLAVARFVGGARRFVWFGSCLWVLFGASSVLAWFATRPDHPGYRALYIVNAIGFPLLLVWISYLTLLLQRNARAEGR